MGWYRVDPDTGKPFPKAKSVLSREPDFVLLNAVPGADDDEEACYLGDGPWDMASTLPKEVEAIVGKSHQWSAEQVRGLFLKDKVPAKFDVKQAKQLRDCVRAFWNDINGCYEDDWERDANADEKRLICKYAVQQLTGEE